MAAHRAFHSGLYNQQVDPENRHGRTGFSYSEEEQCLSQRHFGS
jgi:hypothetical protein